jgi:hypothetical protein
VTKCVGDGEGTELLPNVREMRRAQDCDQMCSCGVLFVVFTAVVLCEIGHAEGDTNRERY